MKNLLLLEFIHTTLSSSSLTTTSSFSLKKSSSTMSSFQSFKSLEKQRFQWPFSSSWTYKHATHVSFEIAKAYKEGNEHFNSSSSHHLSFQNLPSSIIHQKRRITMETIPFLLDRLSKPHTIPNSNFAGLPIALFLPNLHIYH